MKKSARARGELEGDSGRLQGVAAATRVEKEEQEKEENEGCSEFLSSLPPDSIQLNFEITP